jgi:hypothetical protein
MIRKLEKEVGKKVRNQIGGRKRKQNGVLSLRSSKDQKITRKMVSTSHGKILAFWRSFGPVRQLEEKARRQATVNLILAIESLKLII